jgi:hypothetical protein
MKTAINMLLEKGVIRELSVNTGEFEFTSDDPKKLVFAIEAYANQFRSEWIDVNDKLRQPIDFERYEVFGMRVKKRSKQEIGTWIDIAMPVGGKFFNTLDDIDFIITHYRPLIGPAPAR